MSLLKCDLTKPKSNVKPGVKTISNRLKLFQTILDAEEKKLLNSEWLKCPKCGENDIKKYILTHGVCLDCNTYNRIWLTKIL